MKRAFFPPGGADTDGSQCRRGDSPLPRASSCWKYVHGVCLTLCWKYLGLMLCQDVWIFELPSSS